MDDYPEITVYDEQLVAYKCEAISGAADGMTLVALISSDEEPDVHNAALVLTEDSALALISTLVKCFKENEW